jgi:hypothetical protein
MSGDPSLANAGGFQPAAGAWGFDNNNGGVQNEDDDLNEEERERVDKAEQEWEDKKRGYFEFSQKEEELKRQKKVTAREELNKI